MSNPEQCRACGLEIKCPECGSGDWEHEGPGVTDYGAPYGAYWECLDCGHDVDDEHYSEELERAEKAFNKAQELQDKLQDARDQKLWAIQRLLEKGDVRGAITAIEDMIGF